MEKKIVDYVYMQDNFVNKNRIQIEEITKNYVILYIDIDEKSKNMHGILHGGLTYTLADTAMGLLLTEQGKDGVTISSSIQYYRPGKSGKVYAEARVAKSGVSYNFLECIIHDEDGTPLAEVKSVFSNL